MANLREVHLRRSVAPKIPCFLCPSPPNGLLYLDKSCEPNNIGWVTPTSSGLLLTTQTNFAYLMCLVTFEDKELLVITCGQPRLTKGGVQVYNLKTKQLEWRVEGRLTGMKKFLKAEGLTTNDQGHLFVCDDNNKCVQMLNVADGRYLGTLIKNGEQGLGEPARIRWCSKISSFVIIHLKNDKWWISVYKVDVNPQRNVKTNSVSLCKLSFNIET